MTPSLCRRCVSLGAKVLVEKSAGLSAGFTDAEYRAAGAALVADAAKVWRSAELILKVKEPLPAEYELLQDGQALFTYLHLAAGPALTKVLLKKNILGIAYETVEGADGSLPAPQADVADRGQAGDPGRGLLPPVAARGLGRPPRRDSRARFRATSSWSGRATPGRTRSRWPREWGRGSPSSTWTRASSRRSTRSTAVGSSR